MPSRVYTEFDALVDEAMHRIADVGRIEQEASGARKLYALVEVANDTLRMEQERMEKIAAYQELAADTDRAQAIRDANLAAVAAGIL
jgi:hypothetical protein